MAAFPTSPPWIPKASPAGRAVVLRRILGVAGACAAVIILVMGIGHWRKSVFENRVRAFEAAMHSRAYDSARGVAQRIGRKHRRAADLLEYFRAREAFESALKGVDAGLLWEYGGTKWDEVRVLKQMAETSAGTPAEGCQAYRRASLLLTDCRSLIDARQKTRKQDAVSRNASTETKVWNRGRAQDRRTESPRDPAELRERLRKVLEAVESRLGESPLADILASYDQPARNEWQQAADQGVPEAQLLLAWAFDFGVGVAKDDTRATEFYRKAAEQGQWQAQEVLGVWYFNGQGVSKDVAAAVTWWRKAAEQGAPWSMNNLGYCYWRGEGVAQDSEEAARRFRAAAEKGLADSQYSLACMLSEGDGVPKDRDEAIIWYTKAAEQGHPASQNMLGCIYHEGSGLEQDDREAMVWLRKSADGGFAAAQYNLGLCYYNGWGVNRDVAEAIRWLSLAAEQGYSDAQACLREIKNQSSQNAVYRSPPQMPVMRSSPRWSPRQSVEPKKRVLVYRCPKHGHEQRFEEHPRPPPKCHECRKAKRFEYEVWE